MEQNFKCTVCGGQMEIREDQGVIICPYCGETLTYEDESEETDLEDAEEYEYTYAPTEYQYNNRPANLGGNTSANSAGGTIVKVIGSIVLIYFVFMVAMSML